MNRKILALLLTVAVILSVGAVAVLAAPEVSVEETVLLDNEFASVTVTDFDLNGDWGPTFELLVENKSDKDLYIGMEGMSVNGVMAMRSYWGEEIPSGGKVYSDLTLNEDDLALMGVNYIEKINAMLYIRDQDEYERLYTGDVELTMTVGETEMPAVEPVVFDSGFERIDVLTGDDYVFSVVDYAEEGEYSEGPHLTFYMENHTDEIVQFRAVDTTVNGFMCDPYWSCSVMPGMVAYSECSWWKSDLEENHIETVEDFDFTLSVMDGDWNELATAPVSVVVAEGSGESAGAVEGTVLLDNDVVSVAVTGFDPEGSWGPAFEMLVENKTDRTLYVELYDVAVNGMMCTGWGDQVAAGKKGYGELSWDTDDLEKNGINYVETVTGTLAVTDYDEYEQLYTGAVEFTAPVEETEEPAVEPVVFDNGFAQIDALTGDYVFSVMDYDPASEDHSEMPCFVFYMENHTDKAVRFSATDVSVNGFMCDPYWSKTVAPGMAAYSDMYWWSDDLEENHIDSIETVDFDVTVKDNESWDDMTSGSVSIDLTAGAEAPAA